MIGRNVVVLVAALLIAGAGISACSDRGTPPAATRAPTVATITSLPATLTPTADLATQYARAATLSAALPTLTFEQLHAPANSATQTARARPIPTCTAPPGTIPTPVYARPSDAGPALPILQQTAFASAVAAGTYYYVTRTIDLAPDIPERDKWIFVIGHPDCTAERVLVTTSVVNVYEANLPPGGYVVNVFVPTSSHASAAAPLVTLNPNAPSTPPTHP